MGKKRAAATGDQTSPLHEQLAEIVHEHSLFFNQLVELIPARFFLPYSSDDSPWFPGLSNKEKAKFKEQTRDNILKSRRDRLDPTRPASSTLDLLNKSLDEAKQHSLSSDDDDDDEEDEDEHIEEEEDDDDDDEKEVEKSKALVTDQRPVTYEELQRRLRQRIADLAAGRNTRPEAHLKQERKKNNKKLKVKTKKNREKNKDNDTAAASTSTGNNTTGKRKREDGEGSSKKSKVAKPAADITFGQVTIDGKEKKNRKKRLPKEKELERAKRLQEVKKDPEKGKKVSWKAAVSKAAGEKVHDDPRLLKESIKKEKKRQVKSKDKWREREDTVAKAKADKQSKRAGNIKDRIQQNKMRKIEKREKKLMRPGFEGRKL